MRHLSSQDQREAQQPLDYKTGYSNPVFDKLYGHKTKNPYWGTERDLSLRKNILTVPKQKKVSKRYKSWLENNHYIP